MASFHWREKYLLEVTKENSFTNLYLANWTLIRDCFFTGVSEGTIGADRIIKMMTIVNDEVVIEEKGIYSIENFLNARRLMYWQVYLHKTTVCAEKMLINLILRAKDLGRAGYPLPGSIEFIGFLNNDLPKTGNIENPDWLDDFAQLDDLDIWGAIKLWKDLDDVVLSQISKMFLTRNLYKIHLSNLPLTTSKVADMKSKVQKKLMVSDKELNYFFSEGEISNYGYLKENKILILTKKGEVLDVATAADLPNIKAMSKIVKKYYACHAKNITLR